MKQQQEPRLNRSLGTEKSLSIPLRLVPMQLTTHAKGLGS